MRLKRFGIREKMASSKQKVFKLFRFIGNTGKEHSSVSSPNSLFTSTPVKTEEAQLYWYELRKAEALLYWDRWLDRPR